MLLRRQALAYIEMLEEKGQKPRPDVLKTIDELKADMTMEEITAITDGNPSDEYVRSVSKGGAGAHDIA